MAHRDQYDEEYLAALQTVLSSEKRVLFDYLYQCLSIIDGKSASLLQFNSIGIAASTVVLVVLAQQSVKPQPWFSFAAFLTVALTFLMLFSSVMALRADWIYWARTPEIVGGRYIKELLDRRTRRTAWYRISWIIAVICLPIFFLDLVIVVALCVL